VPVFQEDHAEQLSLSPDPVDTLLRPDTNELGKLFGQIEMIDGSIVNGPAESEEIIKNPSLLPRRIALDARSLPSFWYLALRARSVALALQTPPRDVHRPLEAFGLAAWKTCDCLVPQTRIPAPLGRVNV
jgi:hypothetical protein